MARTLGRKSGGASASRKSRKSGTGTSAPPPTPEQSNITDETIQQLCMEALKAKTDQEKKADETRTANAEYRAVLKRAKKLGIMPEVIIIWLADRKLELSDLNSRLAQQNRIYRLMRLPVGTQLGMFDEKTTIATQIDNHSTSRKEAPPEQQAEAAFEVGYQLGLAGKATASQTEYTEDHKYWAEFLRGYSKGQKELMGKRGAPTAAAPEVAPVH